MSTIFASAARGLAAVLVLAAVSLGADGPAPARIESKRFGYSLPIDGLRHVPLNAADFLLLTAHLEEDDDGSALFLDRAVPHVAGSEGWLWEARRGYATPAGRIVTDEWAGRAADSLSVVVSEDRRMVFLVERAGEGREFWAATMRLVGDREKQAADEKRIRAALDTFTTEPEGESGPDDFEDRIFGFRIRLAEFAGPVNGFGPLLREMCSLRAGDRLVGTLLLHLSASSASREEDLAALRRAIEKNGETILSVEPAERDGKPVTVILSWRPEGEAREAVRRLLVWDGPKLFLLTLMLHAPPGEPDPAAAPLLAAMDGFRTIE